MEITKERLIELIKKIAMDPTMSSPTYDSKMINSNRHIKGIEFYETGSKKSVTYITYENKDNVRFKSLPIPNCNTYIEFKFRIKFDTLPDISIRQFFTTNIIKTDFINGVKFGIFPTKIKYNIHQITSKLQINSGNYIFDIDKAEFLQILDIISVTNTKIYEDKSKIESETQVKILQDRFVKYDVK